MKSNKRSLPATLLLGTLGTLALITGSTNGRIDNSAHAQASQRTFPETGKSVQGKFLDYWDKHGGLPQQGYPISEEMQEVSETDGKSYSVQYFERAVFELHPENQPPNDVLLSLLGVFLYNQKYPSDAPNQVTNNQSGSRLFTETGRRVGGEFLDYWTKNGGLAQQGFPISDEFNEVSELDGKTYKVQYFQRAVFEYHPENKPPYDVLLSQLGTFRYRAKYLQPTPTPTPPATGQPQPMPQPAEYAAVRAKFENMTRDQYQAAGYTSVARYCEVGVGVRVLNNALWEAQYFSGQLDPQNPPVILTTGNQQRIVGLAWLADSNFQPPPVLFGQQVPLVSDGFGFVMYALHSFFKPNGNVLFARADPEFLCHAP